jgi:hypothetical protein
MRSHSSPTTALERIYLSSWCIAKFFGNRSTRTLCGNSISEEGMKATVYIATSVDGFIARNNGGIDWLPSGGDTEGGEDYGYQEFIDSVDALVMGRNTLGLTH